MAINSFKEALNKVRSQLLQGKIIKPISPNKYIDELDTDLLPIMLGLIEETKDKVLKYKIQESIQDDIVDGIIDDSEKRKISDILITNKRKAGLASAEHTAKLLAFPYTRELFNEQVLSELKEKVFKITTTEITDTLSKVLKDKLKAGYEKGYSIDKIAKSLDELKSNTLTIARTEINQIVSTSHYRVTEEAKNEIGLRLEKRWVTSGNPNTRDSHLLAEAQGWIPFEDTFHNGLMFPLDAVGKAEEVINCICVLYERVIK